MRRLLDLLSWLACAGGVFQLVLMYWLVVDTDAWSKTPVLFSLYLALALATVAFSIIYNFTEISKDKQFVR